MASMWRRAMVYLGLQDDDELDTAANTSPTATTPTADEPRTRAPARAGDDDDGDDGRAATVGTVRTRPDVRSDSAPSTAPPASTAPIPTRARRPARATSRRSRRRPARRVVRTIGPTTAARVHVVEPQGFNDAQEVGDRLKANQPVILNLQGLPASCSGASSTSRAASRTRSGGTMQRVADQVFLLTPSNVEVSQEEKERLQARGLFQA